MGVLLLADVDGLVLAVFVDGAEGGGLVEFCGTVEQVAEDFLDLG